MCTAGPAGRDAFVERSLERSQDRGYRTIEVAWEWCYRGFLNTLSPISTSVSLDEAPRYSIQKTPSLERSTERSTEGSWDYQPSVARRPEAASYL